MSTINNNLNNQDRPLSSLPPAPPQEPPPPPNRLLLIPRELLFKIAFQYNPPFPDLDLPIISHCDENLQPVPLKDRTNTWNGKNDAELLLIHQLECIGTVHTILNLFFRTSKLMKATFDFISPISPITLHRSIGWARRIVTISGRSISTLLKPRVSAPTISSNERMIESDYKSPNSTLNRLESRSNVNKSTHPVDEKEEKENPAKRTRYS